MAGLQTRVIVLLDRDDHADAATGDFTYSTDSANFTKMSMTRPVKVPPGSEVTLNFTNIVKDKKASFDLVDKNNHTLNIHVEPGKYPAAKLSYGPVSKGVKMSHDQMKGVFHLAANKLTVSAAHLM